MSGEHPNLYPSDVPVLEPAVRLPAAVRLPDGGLDFERTVERFELSWRTTFAAKLKSLGIG